MTSYDLYGTETLTPAEVRDQVQELLGLNLIEHESLYLGEYFRTDPPGGEEVVVRSNRVGGGGRGGGPARPKLTIFVW
jgi:hypothetical protein